MERDRDGEAGEYEIGGVVERVADGDGILHHAPGHDAHGVQRIDADDQHHQPSDQQSLDQVDDRQQSDIDPARQCDLRCPAHAASPAWACALAIMRPSVRSSASSPLTSPTMRPWNITRMRSLKDMTSSSSTETSRIAQPASRKAMSCRW